MMICKHDKNLKMKRLFGRAVVRQDFIVETADEFFYSFLGNRSAYPIWEIVHEEDRQEFMEAFKNASQESEDYYLIRLCDLEGTYFFFLLRFMRKNINVQDSSVIGIEFYEVVSMLEHYDKLREVARKYRKYMSMSNNRYFEYNPFTDEFLVYYYRYLENINIVKMPLSEWEKTVFEQNIIPEEYKEGFQSFLHFLRNGTTDFHLRINMKDFFERGHETDVLIRGDHLFTRADSGVKVVVGTMTPLNLFDRIELEYSSESKRDMLTGLMNKAAIREYVELQIHERKREHIFVVLMDVDHFKQMNETHGYQFGDQVLKRVADIINSVMMDRGLFGRIGGNQFVGALHYIGKTEDDIRLFLKTLNKQIKWEFERDSELKRIPLTLSIGVSTYPKDGNNYKELLSIAEKALHIAKVKGKARYIIYDEEKHRDFEIESSELKSCDNGIGEESNTKKFVAMTNLLLDMRENGLKNIDMVLLTIRDYFRLDGISVFLGTEWIRGNFVGDYYDPYEPFKPDNPLEYLTLFSKDGVLNFNNVESMRFQAPDVYEKLMHQKIRASLQVVEFGENAVPVIVSFDIIDRSKKWAESEIESLSMLGKVMAKLFLARQIKK